MTTKLIEKTTESDISDGRLFDKYLASKQWLTDMEWLEIFPTAQTYLKEKLAELKQDKTRKEENYKIVLSWLYKAHLKDFDFWFASLMVKIWHADPLEKLEKQISNLTWLIYPVEIKVGQITPDMIERAKKYPIDKLIATPIKNFMTTCPFHKAGTEKTASLNTKNNFYYCFACGATGDTIKFLQETRGLGFREAVESLQ